LNESDPNPRPTTEPTRPAPNCQNTELFSDNSAQFTADQAFIYGTARIEGIPDDLTGFVEPKDLPPGRPGAFLVLKATKGPVRRPEGNLALKDGHPSGHREAPKKRPLQHGWQLAVGKLFAGGSLLIMRNDPRYGPSGFLANLALSGVSNPQTGDSPSDLLRL
jgi:hypothetical protein